MPVSHAAGGPVGWPVAVRGLDSGKEYVGGQVRRDVGIVDPPRHKALHESQMLAVEGLECVGVSANLLHTRTSPIAIEVLQPEK